MCKKINRFFPCLLGFYFVASFLIGLWLQLAQTDLPYWLGCIISELLLLAPVIVYIAANKINVLACIPYRKLRWQDALLSLLTGYLLTYDALTMEFRKIKLPKDTHNCAVCGDHPTILEPIDYEQEVCEETKGRFETREKQE